MPLVARCCTVPSIRQCKLFHVCIEYWRQRNELQRITLQHLTCDLAEPKYVGNKLAVSIEVSIVLLYIDLTNFLQCNDKNSSQTISRSTGFGVQDKWPPFSENSSRNYSVRPYLVASIHMMLSKLGRHLIDRHLLNPEWFWREISHFLHQCRAHRIRDTLGDQRSQYLTRNIARDY